MGRLLHIHLFLVTLNGCVEYDNLSCRTDETAVVGWTDVVLDLRRDFIRTREAPIGNLVTDALYEELLPDDVDLAVINAGSILDYSDCGPLPQIDRGPLRLGEIATILPHEQRVVLAEITEKELWDVLEHAVARLAEPSQQGWARQFLQVSHLRFSVDCERPAAIAGQQGERVTEIILIDAAGNEEILDPVNRSETRILKVGINSFLGDGGDGFELFSTAAKVSENRPDFVAVANYVANQPDQTVAPIIEGRILLESSCRQLMDLGDL